VSKSHRLRIYPDHVLREHARPVDNITGEIRTLTEEMKLLMAEEGGIGLAAPQVGVLHRIIVVRDEEEYLTFLNPEIHEHLDKHQMEEGCLSLPGVSVNVTRDFSIYMTAIDISGDQIKMEVEGLTARIIQHEVDHLNGVLIIDHASTVERHLLKKQLRELGRIQQASQ